VDVFEALADPVRRDLLVEVAIRPMRVVDLAAGQPISRPAVSKHLRLLIQAGLLEVAERGRERHYRLRPEPLGQVLDLVEQLTGTAPRLTAQMLDALDTEVHRTSRERRRVDGRVTRKGQHGPTPSKKETA
jgi:DNA-binding transcriptional ArsR family regulator